nr:putative ribonuclease H-like domain-containing protein [Tanacetum cinerariifolium]
LATKDETSVILKTFTTGIENQINHKVKIIKCDNGTEFKNHDLNRFCRMKGIKREFSVTGTPQQNEVAKQNNRTLIKVARTMLTDSLLPIPFWAEAVNTACYVQNRSMNYQLVARNQPNDNAGTKENLDAGKVRKATVSAQQYVLLPLSSTSSQDPQNTADDVADAAFDVKENENDVYISANRSDKTSNKKHDENAKRDDKRKSHPNSPSSTNSFNTASPSVNSVSPNFGIAEKSSFVDPFKYFDDPDMPELEDIIYSDDEEEVDAEADFSNLKTNISVSPILTTRVYKDHHVTQIISDLTSAP